MLNTLPKVMESIVSNGEVNKSVTFTRFGYARGISQVRHV